MFPVRVFIWEEWVIERVIKTRKRHINRLRKKASRLAPRSALQTLAVLRQIEHLEKLNAQRRGASTFHYSK